MMLVVMESTVWAANRLVQKTQRTRLMFLISPETNYVKLNPSAEDFARFN